MDMIQQLLLASLILPFIISLILWKLSQHNSHAQWALPLAWIIPYAWIIDWPPLLPSEANDWLWLLVIISVMINIVIKFHIIWRIIMQTALLLLVLIAIVWPVFLTQISPQLVTELTIVVVIGLTTYFFTRQGQFSTPALSMTISSIGLAIVVALGGSLLIAQLAAALAAMLSLFAINELIRKLQQPAINTTNLIVFIQIYLSLLVIARVYAEIPLGPSALLLAAPLLGLIPSHRFSFIYSVICVITAISWLLLTADASSYY